VNRVEFVKIVAQVVYLAKINLQIALLAKKADF